MAWLNFWINSSSPYSSPIHWIYCGSKLLKKNRQKKTNRQPKRGGYQSNLNILQFNKNIHNPVMLLVKIGNHSKIRVFADQYYRANGKKPFQMNKKE